MYPFNFMKNEELNNNIYTNINTEIETKNVNLEQKPELHNFKDKKILDMLTEAMKDEKQDAEYYANLMHMSKNDEDKELLKNISLQEKKHYAILNEIYKILTGTKTDVNYTPKNISTNLEKEYKESFYNEIKGFEFYRKLYFLFSNPEIRDMVYEIMTDEQNHAAIMNHLLLTREGK